MRWLTNIYLAYENPCRIRVCRYIIEHHGVFSRHNGKLRSGAVQVDRSFQLRTAQGPGQASGAKQGQEIPKSAPNGDSGWTRVPDLDDSVESPDTGNSAQPQKWANFYV